MITTTSYTITDTNPVLLTHQYSNNIEKGIKRGLLVQNMDDTNEVYLGGASVTENDGIALLPKSILAFSDILLGDNELYAIAGLGNTIQVRVMEIP